MRYLQVISCLVFWRENSNVVEITKENLTFEKNVPEEGVIEIFDGIFGGLVDDVTEEVAGMTGAPS